MARYIRAALGLDYPPFDLQLFCGIFTSVWGAWLLNPGITSFDHSASYRALDSLMPEWAWGSLIVLLGVIQLRALLWGTRGARARAAMAGFLMWTMLAALFFISSPHTTAHVAYGIIGLAHAWVYIRERSGQYHAPYI